MIHKMKLLSEPFERIKSGMKLIELRLLDEKRKQVKIKDTITFLKLPKLEEKLSVEVIALQKFSTFNEFATEDNLKQLGMKRTKEQFLKDIQKIYSKEKELKLGVLAINIEKIN